MEYWSIAQVMKAINISRAGLAELRKEDRSFPLPTRVQRAIRWIDADVLAWKAAHTEALRKENAKRLLEVKKK